MSHVHAFNPGDRVHLGGSDMANELQSWFEEHSVVDAWQVDSYDCASGAAMVWTLGPDNKKLVVRIEAIDLIRLNEVS